MSLSDPTAVLIARAEALSPRAGDLGAFLREANSLLEALEPLGDTPRVQDALSRLHGLRTLPALLAERADLAHTSARAAIRLSTALGDSRARAQALRAASVVSAHLGHDAERLSLLMDAVRALPPGSDRRLAVCLRVDVAAATAAIGDFTAARAYLDQAEAMLLPRANPEDAELTALVDMNVARVLRLDGAPEQARSRIALAGRLPGLAPDHLYRAYLAVEAYQCRHALGEPLDREALLAEAKRFQAQQLDALADNLLLLAAKSSHDIAQALELAERAAEIAARVGDFDEEIAALDVVADLLERTEAAEAATVRERLNTKKRVRAAEVARARAAADGVVLARVMDGAAVTETGNLGPGTRLADIVRQATADVSVSLGRIPHRWADSPDPDAIIQADAGQVDLAVRAILRACRDSAVDGATLDMRVSVESPWVRWDIQLHAPTGALPMLTAGPGWPVLERVRRHAHQAEAWATAQTDDQVPSVSVYWRHRVDQPAAAWLRSEVTPTHADLETELEIVEALATHAGASALRRLDGLRTLANTAAARARVNTLRASIALEMRDLEAADDALFEASAELAALERPADRVRALRAGATIARLRGIVAVADPLLDAASVIARLLEPPESEPMRVNLVVDRSLVLIEAGDVKQAYALILRALEYGEQHGRSPRLQTRLRAHAVFQCRILGDLSGARMHLERALAEGRESAPERVRATLAFEELTLKLLLGESVHAAEVEAARSDAERRDDHRLAAAFMGAEAMRIASLRPAAAVELAVEAASTLSHAGERYEALRLLDAASEWSAHAGDLARAAALQAERRRVLENLPLPGAVDRVRWAERLLDYSRRALARRSENPNQTLPPNTRAPETPAPQDIDAMMLSARFTPTEVAEHAHALLQQLPRSVERTRIALVAAAASFNLSQIFSGLDALAEATEHLTELANGDERVRCLRMVTRLIEDSGDRRRAQSLLLDICQIADAEAGLEAQCAMRASLSFYALQAGDVDDAIRWSEEGVARVEPSTIPEREALLTVLRLNLASGLRIAGRHADALAALAPSASDAAALVESTSNWVLNTEAARLKILAHAGAPIALDQVEHVAVEARRARIPWVAGTLCGELAELLERHDPEAALRLATDAVRDMRSCGRNAQALPYARLASALHAQRGDPRAVANAERAMSALLEGLHTQQAFAAMMVARLEPVLRRVEARAQEVRSQ